MKMTGKDWAMLLILAFLWGGSFFLIEIALQDLPVLTLVALRVLLAAAVLWVFVFLRGLKLPTSPGIWLSFAVMGLLNNIIPFSLIVFGQTQISSSLASILNATTPIFAVIAAGLFLTDEPITRNKIAGVITGFAGALVMVGPAALGDNGSTWLGRLALLGAATSYALASVYGRRFHALGIAPAVSAVGQVTMSSVIAVPLAYWFAPAVDFAAVSTDTWLAVAGLAVLSTALAYILYFRVLASAGATNLMLVTFLIPVTAIILGISFLGEHLRPNELFGMALIAASLMIIDGRVFARR